MIQIGNTYFELEITRKRIKNIYLRVINNSIIITCPKYVTNKEIEQFLIDKKDWILKTKDKCFIQNETSKLKIDETIYYLGKPYNLIQLIGKDNIKIQDNNIIIHSKDGTIESSLNVLYKTSKNVLGKVIEERQDKYLRVLQDYGYYLIPNYRYKKLKSAWGICYPKKNEVVINERLIHYNEETIEAILWHELLHFVIPNHSKRFHEVLVMVMPKYEEIHSKLY